jgi:hypothetical protein
VSLPQGNVPGLGVWSWPGKIVEEPRCVRHGPRAERVNDAVVSFTAIMLCVGYAELCPHVDVSQHILGVKIETCRTPNLKIVSVQLIGIGAASPFAAAL